MYSGEKIFKLEIFENTIDSKPIYLKEAEVVLHVSKSIEEVL